GRSPRGGRSAPPRRRRTSPAGGTGWWQRGTALDGTGRSLDEGPERSAPRPDDRPARPRVPGPSELATLHPFGFLQPRAAPGPGNPAQISWQPSPRRGNEQPRPLIPDQTGINGPAVPPPGNESAPGNECGRLTIRRDREPPTFCLAFQPVVTWPAGPASCA